MGDERCHLSKKLECKHQYIYIYINIYIYIHRQTVSFYNNSLVWLDMQDALSWDENLPKFTLDMTSNHSAISVTYVISGIITHI